MNDSDKTVIGVMDTGDKTQMTMAPQSNATMYAANIDCPVCHTPNPPSEMYCMDCGFLLADAPVAVEDMPEVVSVGKLVTPDGVREFSLKPGENIVGRENVDVILADNTVSRRHAKITVENSKVFLEDMGSTNGTKIDGVRLAAGEKTEVSDGSELSFGSSVLNLQLPELDMQELVPSESEDATADEEVIDNSEIADEVVIETVPEESFEETMQEVVDIPAAPIAKLISKDGSCSFDLKSGINTIGRRDGANDIVIPDPYCSGRHADLLVEDESFTVTDIGSTNGTLVNGVKLDPNSPKQIQSGDEITFGRTVFGLEVV